MIEMKTNLRTPAAFAAGFAVSLLFGFAALAQTASDSAAKLNDSVPAIYSRLTARLFAMPSPRGCFCDEDCYAAILKKEQLLPGFKLRLASPSFNPARAEASVIKRNEPDDIRVIDLEGLKKVLQRDPKDTRPLLINFWATWCDPCREEFPDLVKIDNDYRGKNLNFVAVSLDDISDVKSVVPKFLSEMKAAMPVVLLNVNDPEPAIKAVDPSWDGQLPATFLYDKDGKIVFKHFGKIDAAELRTSIDKTLGSKQ